MIIEEIILNFLSEKVNIPVLTEKQKKDNPKQYYLIEKTGGTTNNHIKRSTITIQSYGNSLYEASIFNEQVKYQMEYNAIALEQIVSVSLNSDYNYTDTTTKEYRYQAVFDIVHY